uniref:BZIP domain-containing protein n=1 Tax=Euplotes crassus TaxID=5936 RepID=A0A7S3K8Z8_EUPCR|mmetsp:Transcript_12226/g.12257  ORF Transcript_12226/g.12257 Transcript_12226/m.12257 type:complete len:428 (+) Transcript_12226:378-1661(+)|eukprot:CAMPEP_0197010732 /NCGR_PEP_ID=MMETSP1380-20130617/55617_1 /TAXON_ID=5936 /ORGANISM="Euplotes crassus, Strain CT5" /LENGTH=427 /DNA_ID=CAMNT_0042432871 /DNA_START=375 /DNA_END=1658 /DNA_ORIENTATION=+
MSMRVRNPKTQGNYLLKKNKELNRKSASQCRKRRKEYVEQLEKRVDFLENEVHCLKRKLRFYEQKEKLEALSQKESILQYLTGKYDEYDKLESIVDNYEKTNIEETEINKIINTIKIRQSSQGFVRKQTVNYLLKKVIEKIVPGHVKYIVSSCANENGYFEKARGRKLAKNLEAKTQRGKYVDYAQKCRDPENHIWKEIIYAMGLNSEEIKLLKKQRAKILKFKEKFSNNLSKFLKIKKEMFKISADIEKILDDVGTNVKPIQIARFLKYVDKIKHRKEMDVFHLWGVKSNKFRVRKDKIGTQDLLCPSIEKVRPTYALVKKKEKKKMKSENDKKIASQLEMNKLKFESTHGKLKNSPTQSNNISPDQIAKEILANEIKQEYKSDDEDSLQVKINLTQNPAFLNLNHDSDDSGLPDSACESVSSSEE